MSFSQTQARLPGVAQPPPGEQERGPDPQAGAGAVPGGGAGGGAVRPVRGDCPPGGDRPHSGGGAGRCALPSPPQPSGRPESAGPDPAGGRSRPGRGPGAAGAAGAIRPPPAERPAEAGPGGAAILKSAGRGDPSGRGRPQGGEDTMSRPRSPSRTSTSPASPGRRLWLRSTRTWTSTAAVWPAPKRKPCGPSSCPCWACWPLRAAGRQVILSRSSPVGLPLAAGAAVFVLTLIVSGVCRSKARGLKDRGEKILARYGVDDPRRSAAPGGGLSGPPPCCRPGRRAAESRPGSSE